MKKPSNITKNSARNGYVGIGGGRSWSITRIAVGHAWIARGHGSLGGFITAFKLEDLNAKLAALNHKGSLKMYDMEFRRAQTMQPTEPGWYYASTKWGDVRQLQAIEPVFVEGMRGTDGSWFKLFVRCWQNKYYVNEFYWYGRVPVVLEAVAI